MAFAKQGSVSADAKGSGKGNGREGGMDPRAVRVAGPWLPLLMAAVCCLVLPAASAAGGAAPRTEIDEAEIYYGDPGSFRSPAVLDADEVYSHIPEYREIRDRGLDPSDARYLYLMRAASERFRAAVSGVADSEGYDLVGGLGSIRIEGRTVPDITSLVVRKLAR